MEYEVQATIVADFIKHLKNEKNGHERQNKIGHRQNPDDRRGMEEPDKDKDRQLFGDSVESMIATSGRTPDTLGGCKEPKEGRRPFLQKLWMKKALLPSGKNCRMTFMPKLVETQIEAVSKLIERLKMINSRPYCSSRDMSKNVDVEQYY